MKKEQVFSPEKENQFHCLIHGSINKFRSEIANTTQIFQQNGIRVMVDLTQEIGSINGGFAKFKGQENLDNSLIEGKFLQNLNNDTLGFCYFINPGGYIGKGSAYELAHATSLNIPTFFLEKPDLDFYSAPQNSVWKPMDLVRYIKAFKKLPDQSFDSKEWSELCIPRSVVAAGAIIEWQPKRGEDTQILLVQTHKWGNRFSIVGEKIERNETINDALIRGVYEETGLEVRGLEPLCTFSQLKNSGYHQPLIDMIFVDSIVRSSSRRVKLNNEAQYSVWIPVGQALNTLDIEPNARKSLEDYLKIKRVD